MSYRGELPWAYPSGHGSPLSSGRSPWWENPLEILCGQLQDAVSNLGDFSGKATTGCCYQDFDTEVLRCADRFSKITISRDEHRCVDDTPPRQAYKVQGDEGVHPLLLPYRSKLPAFIELGQHLNWVQAQLFSGASHSPADRPLETGLPLGYVS